MKPKKVTLDGKVLDGVEDVLVGLETPTKDGGHLARVQPKLGTLTIHKAATGRPSVTLFDLATNGNGKQKFFDGEIQLVDSNDAQTFVIAFSRGFVEQWEIRQTSEDAGGKEVVTLRLGSMTFTSGADNATVNFEQF